MSLSIEACLLIQKYAKKEPKVWELLQTERKYAVKGLGFGPVTIRQLDLVALIGIEDDLMLCSVPDKFRLCERRHDAGPERLVASGGRGFAFDLSRPHQEEGLLQYVFKDDYDFYRWVAKVPTVDSHMEKVLLLNRHMWTDSLSIFSPVRIAIRLFITEITWTNVVFCDGNLHAITDMGGR